MKYRLFFWKKGITVAVALVPEKAVFQKLLGLGSKVYIYLLFVVIYKTEVEIHIEGQIVLSCFPEQQVKPVGVSSRKVTFAVGMYHI